MVMVIAVSLLAADAGKQGIKTRIAASKILVIPALISAIP
jgi:hypothetical protein